MHVIYKTIQNCTQYSFIKKVIILWFYQIFYYNLSIHFCFALFDKYIHLVFDSCFKQPTLLNHPQIIGFVLLHVSSFSKRNLFSAIARLIRIDSSYKVGVGLLRIDISLSQYSKLLLIPLLFTNYLPGMYVKMQFLSF